MGRHKNILIELGCEELPVSAQAKLPQQLATSLSEELRVHRIVYDGLDFFVTPRRIALLIRAAAQSGEKRKKIIEGPTTNLAYTEGTQPTPACLGFARSCGVIPKKLKVIKTARGERVCHEKIIKGEKTLIVLPRILNEILTKHGKGMQWNNQGDIFIRPVRWLVLIADKKVIPWRCFGLKSGKKSYGHRFLAPQALVIDDAAHYEKILAAHHVILSPEKRAQSIRRQAEKIARKIGARIDASPELAHEIAGLTEYPVAVLGHFDEAFLQLPYEVLHSVISSTQRSFLLMNAAKRLLPSFIFVANIISDERTKLIKGNEAVIKPRLADAVFFYTQDRKKSLTARFNALARLAFFSHLGDMKQKSLRCEALSEKLHQQCGTKPVGPAARLAKCDLMSLMVQEFPALQGIMGGYYFLADKKSATETDKRCAQTIRQHYLPQRTHDSLPDSIDGCLLSLADKLDSLFGLFYLDYQPKGTGDPYGLRRNAVGIIRILIEKELDMDLDLLLEFCADCYTKHNKFRLPVKKREELRRKTLSFINERVVSYGTEKNLTGDLIRAAFSSLKPGETYRNWLKAQALMRISFDKQIQLIGLNKRLKNILAVKKIPSQEFKPKYMKEKAEKELFRSYKSLSKSFAQARKKKDYDSCCRSLIEISDPLALFFEEIMVMTEEKKIRNNRLALLDKIHELFLEVGDLTGIALKK